MYDHSDIGKSVKIIAEDGTYTGTLSQVVNSNSSLTITYGTKIVGGDSKLFNIVEIFFDDIINYGFVEDSENDFVCDSKVAVQVCTTKKTKVFGDNKISKQSVQVNKRIPTHLKIIQAKEGDNIPQLLYEAVEQEISGAQNIEPILKPLSAKDLELIHNLKREVWKMTTPSCYFMVNEKWNEEQLEDLLRGLWHTSPLAICANGCTIGRNGKLSLLTLATPDYVVLLDAQVCKGELVRAVASILQSEAHEKLVYEGRWLVDLLFHQFGVKLVNVVDLQLVDLALLQRGNYRNMPQQALHARTLQTSLKDVLHLSKDAVQQFWIREDMKQLDEAVWLRRPMCYTLINCALRDLIHLLPLYYSLIRSLIQPILERSQRYAYSVCELPNEDAIKIRNDCSLDLGSHFDHLWLRSSSNELHHPAPSSDVLPPPTGITQSRSDLHFIKNHTTMYSTNCDADNSYTEDEFCDIPSPERLLLDDKKDDKLFKTASTCKVAEESGESNFFLGTRGRGKCTSKQTPPLVLNNGTVGFDSISYATGNDVKMNTCKKLDLKSDREILSIYTSSNDLSNTNSFKEGRGFGRGYLRL